MQDKIETVFPIRLTGSVVHGKAKGRTVGMPTANLAVTDQMKLPKEGVYAARVFIGEEVYLGVTNIGTRPSVDDRDEVTIETLILDFDRDVYGEEITLELHAFLRPTLRFESLQAVRLQVEKDSLQVRELFR